jgi:nucleotide sugar dehydrogenase
MNVCVVGLGRIGLPLSVQIARSGQDVIGVDTSPHVVELVNRGIEPFPGEENLGSFLLDVTSTGRLRATSDTAEAVRTSSVVIVVVPVVVGPDGTADHSNIDAATQAIAAGLTGGTLVCYETTLPVGTTRTRLTPMLSSFSGLEFGRDFFVCHSPERVYSGRVFADLRSYPKLVGGVDAQSAELAIRFYRSVIEFDDRADLNERNGVWDLGSADAAELTKLAETTYRDINIAFANELARFADEHEVDVQRVIDAANSQPFSHIHRPGVAVGGHCIPVYPRFYLSGDPHAVLPAAARDVNDSMPNYAVTLLERELGSLRGRIVVVLGLAYRGGVKESFLSGAFELLSILEASGATALVHDPYYSSAEIQSFGLKAFCYGARVDACILQADHDQYRSLDPDDLPGLECLVDGRNCVAVQPFSEAGIPVLRIGSPDVHPSNTIHTR